MPVIQELEWTFNSVAAEYDRWRPDYPPQLYQDIFSYHPIDQSSRLLEIGIGTGQATTPFLKTSCTLTAVELGSQLAAYVKNKFHGYQNFDVVHASFQEFDEQEQTYDLIYSASAFHWIPEEIGYPKVYRMLKPGGAFARFANHPYYEEEQKELYAAIQKVYNEYMPCSKPSPEYTEAAAKLRSDNSRKFGFTETAYRLYHRARTYRAKDYLSLLGTYSDHIVLDESKKEGFYSGIQAAIDRFGGTITLSDTIDLQLARKPVSH